MAGVVAHGSPLSLHHTIAPRFVRGTCSNANAPCSPLLLEALARQLTSVVGVEAKDVNAMRARPRVVFVHGEMRVAL